MKKLTLILISMVLLFSTFAYAKSQKKYRIRAFCSKKICRLYLKDMARGQVLLRWKRLPKALKAKLKKFKAKAEKLGMQRISCVGTADSKDWVDFVKIFKLGNDRAVQDAVNKATAVSRAFTCKKHYKKLNPNKRVTFLARVNAKFRGYYLEYRK